MSAPAVEDRLRPRRAARRRRSPAPPREPAPRRVLQYSLCLHCDRTFASKKSVSKHVNRVHGGAAATACLYCAHQAADGAGAVKHMAQQHAEQYFACVPCRVRLASAEARATHVCRPERRRDSPPEDHPPAAPPAFDGIVISCEPKATLEQDITDIEDKITTNLIVPSNKVPAGTLDKSAVIVLDDIQWNKRIPPNLAFHKNDAEQILSRLGVVHRSPRAPDPLRRDPPPPGDAKFERCFDTSFYSKVASNVHENLTKYLEGTFGRAPPDPDANVIKTRKAKNSVVINAAEGFPILLACAQYSRCALDAYMPRCAAPRHRWKWDGDNHTHTAVPLDPHVNACIVTLISGLDIWTQLCMRRKFDAVFDNQTFIEKKTDKRSILGEQLKEILESRVIPKRAIAPATPTEEQPMPTTSYDFPSCLGLQRATAKPEATPAVLSGEWARPRCYVCCACGAKSRDGKALSAHIALHHPHAQVAHYEVVGEALLEADILKHLYLPRRAPGVQPRSRPVRGLRDCTKCGTSVSLERLHQHMVECAGDLPATRRRPRRHFGVRRRRTRQAPNPSHRHANRHNAHHRRARRRPRTEVGDAETIRKMLADLPAKRHRVLLNPSNSGGRRLDQRAKILVKKRPPDEQGGRRTRSGPSTSAAPDRKQAVTRQLARKTMLRGSKKGDGGAGRLDVRSGSAPVRGRTTRGGGSRGGGRSGDAPPPPPPPAAPPAPAPPLKHSIARLTADADTHDKAVQFQPHFLVQQECYKDEEAEYAQASRRLLFENETVADKLDKPPLHGNFDSLVANKNKANKPRKGLNDCIAMLKNKLEPSPVSKSMGHRSVQCDTDDIEDMEYIPPAHAHTNPQSLSLVSAPLDLSGKSNNASYELYETLDLSNKTVNEVPAEDEVVDLCIKTTKHLDEDISLDLSNKNRIVDLSQDCTMNTATNYSTVKKISDVIAPLKTFTDIQLKPFIDIQPKTFIDMQPKPAFEPVTLSSAVPVRPSTQSYPAKPVMKPILHQEPVKLMMHQEPVKPTQSVKPTTLQTQTVNIPTTIERTAPLIKPIPQEESVKVPVYPQRPPVEAEEIAHPRYELPVRVPLHKTRGDATDDPPIERPSHAVINKTDDTKIGSPLKVTHATVLPYQAPAGKAQSLSPPLYTLATAKGAAPPVALAGPVLTTAVATNTARPSSTVNETEGKSSEIVFPIPDLETAKKIAMLPKEILEILGKMPTDHRNQLLNVLPQYMVYNTGVKQLKLVVDITPESLLPAAGLSALASASRSEIATQTSGTPTEETCPPEFLNVDTERYLIDPVTGALTERVPKDIQDVDTFAVPSPAARQPRLKESSEKTASLRAVRIKSSERRKSQQLVSSSLVAPLAVQQAEVSSTQHSAKTTAPIDSVALLTADRPSTEGIAPTDVPTTTNVLVPEHNIKDDLLPAPDTLSLEIDVNISNNKTVTEERKPVEADRKIIAIEGLSPIVHKEATPNTQQLPSVDRESGRQSEPEAIKHKNKKPIPKLGKIQKTDLETAANHNKEHVPNAKLETAQVSGKKLAQSLKRKPAPINNSEPAPEMNKTPVINKVPAPIISTVMQSSEIEAPVPSNKDKNSSHTVSDGDDSDDDVSLAVIVKQKNLSQQSISPKVETPIKTTPKTKKKSAKKVKRTKRDMSDSSQNESVNTNSDANEIEELEHRGRRRSRRARTERVGTPLTDTTPPIEVEKQSDTTPATNQFEQDIPPPGQLLKTTEEEVKPDPQSYTTQIDANSDTNCGSLSLDKDLLSDASIQLLDDENMHKKQSERKRSKKRRKTETDVAEIPLTCEVQVEPPPKPRAPTPPGRGSPPRALRRSRRGKSLYEGSAISENKLPLTKKQLIFSKLLLDEENSNRIEQTANLLHYQALAQVKTKEDDQQSTFIDDIPQITPKQHSPLPAVVTDTLPQQTTPPEQLTLVEKDTRSISEPKHITMAKEEIINDQPIRTMSQQTQITHHRQINIYDQHEANSSIIEEKETLTQSPTRITPEPVTRKHKQKHVKDKKSSRNKVNIRQEKIFSVQDSALADEEQPQLKETKIVIKPTVVTPDQHKEDRKDRNIKQVNVDQEKSAHLSEQLNPIQKDQVLLNKRHKHKHRTESLSDLLKAKEQLTISEEQHNYNENNTKTIESEDIKNNSQQKRESKDKELIHVPCVTEEVATEVNGFAKRKSSSKRKRSVSSKSETRKKKSLDRVDNNLNGFTETNNEHSDVRAGDGPHEETRAQRVETDDSSIPKTTNEPELREIQNYEHITADNDAPKEEGAKGSDGDKSQADREGDEERSNKIESGRTAKSKPKKEKQGREKRKVSTVIDNSSKEKVKKQKTQESGSSGVPRAAPCYSVMRDTRARAPRDGYDPYDIDLEEEPPGHDSDDSSKSDEPLVKYVDDAKSAAGHDENQVPLTPSKKDGRKRKATEKSEDPPPDDTQGPDTDEQRSERFMESFGFFSERKPRKSNLLASKKISETFHIIASEGEEGSSEPKERRRRKSSAAAGEGECSAAQCPAKSGASCELCRKEFKRPDNYLRHMLGLPHVSRLAQREIDAGVQLVHKEPNYLLVYSKHLERLRLLTEKIEKRKEEEEDAPKYALPSMTDIMIEAKIQMHNLQTAAKRCLNNDEELFVHCCEMLKEPRFEPGSGGLLSLDDYEQFRIKPEEKDSKSDGDVDSITAKAILESEEVRTLEHDLIAGIQKAAEAKKRATEQSPGADLADADRDAGRKRRRSLAKAELVDIDIFEDKFDKIKRKSRSQAVAAKSAQTHPEPSTSNKEKKKSDKKKSKKISKKSLQSSIPTKGALKGFDGIKVSIPTSEIKLPLTARRRRSSGKKRRDKKGSESSGRGDSEPPRDVYAFSEDEQPPPRYVPRPDPPDSSADDDDFVYMSDDYLCSADETENSLLSAPRRRDAAEKCAVMGRIFKNNALRADRKPKAKPPKANLDQLFDSLLEPDNGSLTLKDDSGVVSSSQRRSSADSSSVDKTSPRASPSPPRPPPATNRPALEVRAGPSRAPDEAPQRARRKCAVGKQNVLAETWSSESEGGGERGAAVGGGPARRRRARKGRRRRTEEPSTHDVYCWSSEAEEPAAAPQHGWIVGDSHKKLVTMLAHAKGRKRDDKRPFLD